MRNTDIADYRNRRLCNKRKLGYLSTVAHTHLNNSRLSILVHPQKRSRQTDIVVEIALRFKRIKPLVEHEPCHFLGRRFADAARQSDNGNVKCCPVPVCKHHESLVCVLNHKHRAVRVNSMMNNRRRSSVCESGSGEIMSVKVFAFDSDIKTTGLTKS